MQCPRCSRAGFQPGAPCGQCAFTGAPEQVEEWGHVAYLLGEIDTWREIEAGARGRLRRRYQARREEIEDALGLRPPPLSAHEVRELQGQIARLALLDSEVVWWGESGRMPAARVASLRATIARRSGEAQARLAQVAQPGLFPDLVGDRLAQISYLLQVAGRAHGRGYFVNSAAYRAVRDSLTARREALEVEAGLRRPPRRAPAPRPGAAPPAPVAPPPKKTREPITWERVSQTLLSERTLNILLFLGAFLLMAAATTYVVYNWEKLPSPVQLAFIVLFTLAFYGAGWFLRVRMALRASGIAVTAIGSLLVPLDFYAIFVAGGLWPPGAWPWVWLVASTACLPVYLWTAIRIRAEFFAYLVAAAAGSLVCAALEVAGIDRAWWLTAIAALSLAAGWLAYRLRATEGAWCILAAPLSFSALVATSVALPFTVGWWLLDRAAGPALDASLAAGWALAPLLYACAAHREKSALLAGAAATSLPAALFFVLRLLFEPWGIESPWYATGWALLAGLYLWAGRRQAPHALAPWGRITTGGGLGLAVLSTAWAALDPWAAATTHALLAAVALLAILSWARPHLVPLASLLAFSAITFAMAGAHLEPAELCLGWALLSVLHVLASRALRARPAYAARLLAAVPILAALTLVPPLALRHEPLLTYAVGHWIGLAAWLLWLDRAGEDPALGALLARSGPLRASALHWAVALPLPFFAALVYTRFTSPGAWLGVAMLLIAWAMAGVGYWILDIRDRRLGVGWPGWAWLAAGWGGSVAGVALTTGYFDQALLGVALLLASALYFSSAWVLGTDLWLIPGGLVLPLGLLVLLDFWQVPWAQQSLVLAAVTAGYLLCGVWLEERCAVARDFVAPLHAVAHLVAVAAVAWGLAPGLGHMPWPDSARLWAAAGQLLLGLAYGTLAWFHARERWAHAAAWLGVVAGGLVATAYSQGRGSSAFKAALLAVAYVLAERALASGWLRRRWAGAARAWPLYRRPLLVAGWAVSAGAVALALVRNLLFLGGGYTREMWAAAGITTLVALYAAAAWLYRRRIFLWLAAPLLFVPWTILAQHGWLLWMPPRELSHLAISWTALAWLELAAGLALTRRIAGDGHGLDGGLPLRAVANGFMALALLVSAFDSGVASVTWGAGLVFYLVQAAIDRHLGLPAWRASRFICPAAFVAPAWTLHLLHFILPTSPPALYGLLLLAQAFPFLALGLWLHRRLDSQAAVPVYLSIVVVGYAGTLLVAGHQPLLAFALAWDALLCLFATRFARRPEWGFPAAALGAAALWVALVVAGVPLDRRGWGLVALGADYLALALVLRSPRIPHLRPCAAAPLAAAFAAVSLGLVPSSLDDTAAFWGYLGAASVVAAGAVALRRPLILVPAAVLLAVPYGVGVTWLDLPPGTYGLAIFPGVVAALALAHLLDSYAGRPRGRLPASLDEALGWWAAPFYAWGYLGALVGAGLSWPHPARLAVALALAALVFVHATWRFRLRGFLLFAAALAQGAVLAAIDAAGWLAEPAWAALAFLPATLATAALAIGIELERREGSPLTSLDAAWMGWSRPLYLLLVADLLLGQVMAFADPQPGAVVTLTHALLLAALATLWITRPLALTSLSLGLVTLFQGLRWAATAYTDVPVGIALLALAYGIAGYGLWVTSPGSRRACTWQQPLEWGGLGLSALALLWAAAITGLDLVPLLIRTFLGRADTFDAYTSLLRTAMWVLALLGLLYLAAAVARRLWVAAYAAIALLFGAWAIWWRFFQGMAAFQWYAIPAGFYLLAVGWLEWRRDHRAIARWIDRAGVLLWLGSAWWQSLPGVAAMGRPGGYSGASYALIMGLEGLLLVWWGSARRQKRFLYAGVVAIVLDVVTQSVEPLLSANRWIVFGLAGTFLIAMAVLVERQRERLRTLSSEWRQGLDAWE
ncbi:MAG: hypothetical protein JXA93_18520 [Anaerolineae bacterium]|nr:hypothetical protein [Anaerolineae bacterium]